MIEWMGRAKKALAAAAGAVGVAVSLGLLSGTAMKWTTGLIAVATAFVVYYVPYVPKAKATDGQ
jgi:hypothetical protein